MGETLTLNCTALVEFNTGVDIQWSYPGKLVRGSDRFCRPAFMNKNLTFASFLPDQTNSLVDLKPHREILSQATEAASILTIHRVNVTDSGRYSCNVTSIDTTQSQQTRVIVYGEQRNGTAHVFSDREHAPSPFIVCLFAWPCHPWEESQVLFFFLLFTLCRHLGPFRRKESATSQQNRG